MTVKFNGFQEGDTEFTGIPDAFFKEILPVIQDLNELKVCLYLLWKARSLGNFGLPITVKSIMMDKVFSSGFSDNNDDRKGKIITALKSAVRDTILIGPLDDGSQQEVYFINSPQGRKAAREFSGKANVPNLTLDHIQPNIFRLYEENIGPLTPLIADELRDAEERYPKNWIGEAIQIALKNNVRRWKYVQVILDRWQKEGRDGTDRRNAKEDHRRYLKGEYGEIGHH